MTDILTEYKKGKTWRQVASDLGIKERQLLNIRKGSTPMSKTITILLNLLIERGGGRKCL